MLDKCCLCLQTKKLKQSHIIPRFVFLWYKRTSVSALRGSDAPNLRVQDGPKEYLLCDDCENKFSLWETPFSSKIFSPLHAGQSSLKRIHYGPWALKFAVSVSWRVLTYHRRNMTISGLSSIQERAVERALEAWRLFVLDSAPLPARFQQHLLPLDVIERHTLQNASPFLNRYLLRGLHMDVVGWGDSILVFTKMFRIIIFGFIHVKRPGHWKGTRIDTSGTVGGSVHYYVPQPIIELLNKKAQESMTAHSQLSRRQREKIRNLFKKSGNAIRGSEVARAMSYDIAHSGSAAFLQDDETEN